MTVWDETRLSSTQTVTIKAVDSQQPVVKITSPLSGTIFDDNQQFTFAADVSDEETPTDQLVYRWEVRMVHSKLYPLFCFILYLFYLLDSTFYLCNAIMQLLVIDLILYLIYDIYLYLTDR